MKTIIIPNPSIKEVNMWLSKKPTKKDAAQEKVLRLVFNNMFPDNSNFNGVLIKCTLLNSYYSTQIYNLYSVADHIYRIKNLDKRLKKIDPKLVDDLSKCTISGKIRVNYSFATKYCFMHNNDYPIYDKFVEKMLVYFKKRDKFYHFKNADLKKYNKYLDILDNFKKFYNLSNFSVRQLDIYLWNAGKYYFQ